MTPSKMLAYCCVSFLLGVSLASLIKMSQIFIWAFLFLGIILIFPYLLNLKYKNILMISGFCILFSVFGILRFQVVEFDIQNDKLSKLNDLPEKITLTGKIIDGPDIRDTFQKIKVKIDNTNSVVLVTLGRYPEYNYLDKIKITGNLKTPFVTEDFNYKNYLMKDGIYSVMDFPKTELISLGHSTTGEASKHSYNAFSFLYEKILFLKSKLTESIDSNFSRTHSPVLRGIILGDDKTISQDLKNKFNSAGLSHVTAVSGSNIVILASVLISFLLFIGFWRQQAFYFSIIFIWFYVLLVGLPSSAVRAAIMGSIFLLSQHFGRQNTSSRTIILAAALMVFQNPFLLFYDIGFQLSFLASMGIIYLKPLFDNLFIFRKKILPELILKMKTKNLFDIISVTLSAQIFALPIIAYNFGNISLVAPFTNLLILPIIPLLMTFGFSSAILGIFSHFLGWVFYLPCWILLIYFLKILDIFYQPWAVLVINIPWIWFLIYYLILVFLIRFLNRKLKPKFLGY